MCFSATASFTAAALLGGAGAFLVNRFKEDRSKIFLALIPCFFAAQQFSEGVLWLAFNHDAYGTIWSYAAQYSFMFFAYLFWPVWIPFSYLMSEKKTFCKSIMGACLAAGMIFYCYLIFQFYTTPEIPAKVVHHSIVYADGNPMAKLLYLALVLVPIFASSIRRMWIIGLLTAISFLVADYVYTYAYASIWCFVSGLIFIGLCFVLKPDASEGNSRA